MNIKGLKVLVVGAGISGRGAVRLLSDVGAEPILFDMSDKAVVEDMHEQVSFYVGELPEHVEKSIDMVVLSPGVPTDIPFLDSFRERHIRIWGEVELAYEFSKGSLLAVTGTNGKTTTTALLGEIMKNYVKKLGKGEVFVVGNIGDAYTAEALKTGEDSITVAEISSFQLETIERFRPGVSAILNITPDHLNRHHTMENYVAIKEKIAMNQTEEDTIVLNYDDEYTRRFGKETKAKVVYFTVKDDWKQAEIKGDILHLDGSVIYYNEEKIIDVNDMQLIGSHNYENVMAAAGMAASYGVPTDLITETIRSFKAVEHRIEFVETVNGVDYYNDSKGTNPDAAIKGIRAMRKNTVLIGGGFDKKSEYDEWIDSFDGKVKLLILLGQTAEDIADCARRHGFDRILMVQDMAEAVREAAKASSPGEAVLLSPACASWGMFKNYEERGRVFKEEVRKLQ